MENQVRELLRDLAEDMPRYPLVPARLQPRARGRIALIFGTTLIAVVVLGLGAFAGVRALVRAQRPVPANHGPAPTGAATLSGPIAFSKGGDDNAHPLGAEQVYLLAPDGTQIQLTHTSKLPDNVNDQDSNNEPVSWSPDGSQLIVQRNWGDQQDLFLVNVDGSPEIRLTNSTEWEGDALFSPDGSMIAFQKGDGIAVMNADGSGVRELVAANFPESYFSWSPDGTRIVFAESSSARTFDNDIYVMNVDDTVKTRLTTGDHSRCKIDSGITVCDRYVDPVWSPDGSKIAFVGVSTTLYPLGGEIYVMNADGSGVTPLTAGSGAPTDCREPAWSLDSSKIAVTCDAGVFILDPNGMEISQLAPQGWYGTSWSPDGSEVGLNKDHHLYVVNANGTDLTRVTDSTDREWGVPVWRP